ncbi:hypothetical protein V6N12_063789 [Hibiscus sabdariffa]|uniref:Uncharacterized protein n=1 Tax=Hibiscus sabdariffa TaxID=183260 RepID=A0ABR1ZF97_9ROSI
MSNPSFPLGFSSLPCATSPSGRPPDLLTVWPALTPVKEDRPAEPGIDQGMDVEGEGRQGFERLDGDGLRDMEISIQSVVTGTGQGVVADSGEKEGPKEGPRKATFKDMVMGRMEVEDMEYPIEDMEVEQHGREQSDMAVYGPWMQAPSRGRRVGQTRKVQVDKGLPDGGANGSRFAVLSMHDEGKDSDADAVTAQLRDVVINAGPSVSV